MAQNLELDNLEPNILCNECSNIKLLGIEFLNSSNNISDILKIYSLCMFNHKHTKNKKNEINEMSLNDIFSNKPKKHKNNTEILCENCQKYPIDYSCISCKRNICEKCFTYHKSHNFYENKKYLLINNLEGLKKEFNKSKKIMNNNILIIEKQINTYKSQLKILEDIFEEYKKINDKLINLSTYIINKYNNLLELKKPIYYPIYFNIKNVLLFNFQELKISGNNRTIKSYSDILFEKINSGCYFLINYSNLSKNLIDYNKTENIINLNLINFDNFKKLDIGYSNFTRLDKYKIIGITIDENDENYDCSLDVYNIKNENVETSIKLCSIDDNYKLYYKDNIILAMNDLQIYIIDSNNFTIIQEIKLKTKSPKKDNNSRESNTIWGYTRYVDPFVEELKNYHNFIYGEIVSENTIFIIYEGNLYYLNDEYSLNYNIDIINFYESFDEDNSENYIYLLIYNKKNNNYILDDIKVLLQKHIGVDQVDFTSSKHFEVEDKFPYCTFSFDSLNKYSENKYIIAFKSRIVAKRDQYNYYITDDKYSDETIYYSLDIKEDQSIEEIICSTEENSFLFKDEKENKFYFLLNKSKDSISKLKNVLKDYELIEIITDNLNYRNLLIQNKNVLGWNNNSIFLGKIFSHNLEIILNKKFNEGDIYLVMLNPNYILYNLSIFANKENNSDDENKIKEDDDENDRDKNNEDIDGDE